MNGRNEYGPSALGQGLSRLLVAVLVGALAMGLFAVRGCQKGPFGRRQLVTMSTDQQQALGAQAFGEVLHNARVLEGGPVVADVEEVTRRLVRATRNPEFLRLSQLPERHFDWDVKVVASKEVNAFCLPGGKMVVYTAILPVCQTDAGLATVMGHEIAHALAQHGAERMAQQRLAQIGMAAASGTLGDMNPAERARLMMLLNAGAKFGILKYSRQHESEADHVGLLLMATAGYNPEESVKFWERMKKLGGKAPVEFLSTHPSHETRIRDLVNWMPQALSVYRASEMASSTHKLHLP
ncbi:MAG: M48 family metallopeptidase [Gemmataceae bacterium]